MSKKKQIINNSKLSEALNLPDNEPYSPVSLLKDTSPILITLFWYTLTYFYKSNGFVQTAVNQIVDDAFRNDGLIIDSKTLDTDEIEELKQALIDNGDIEAIKDCLRWGQLYGGGLVIANTEQNYELPLNKNNLKGKKLKFLAADRWQCMADNINPELSQTFTLSDCLAENRNGIKIDKSRVAIFTGVKAPYQLRVQLQGWGLSIFEAVIPALTQYLKAMGVTLELLDEAKIDVVKIFGLAEMLMSPDAAQKVRSRIDTVSANKNYKSSIVMDANDDYQQKQITFGGLPEMITQIQYLICSALKRPYSKIFGKGANGFSSGEDDLENYNSIVDSEIRQPAASLIKWVVNLRALQLFGRELPDFRPKWKPLRIMTEKEQAEINNRKLADYLTLLEHQIMTPQQVAEKLTEDSYILFSDEEIAKLSDEMQQADIERSVREDINV